MSTQQSLLKQRLATLPTQQTAPLAGTTKKGSKPEDPLLTSLGEVVSSYNLMSKGDLKDTLEALIKDGQHSEILKSLRLLSQTMNSSMERMSGDRKVLYVPRLHDFLMEITDIPAYAKATVARGSGVSPYIEIGTLRDLIPTVFEGLIVSRALEALLYLHLDKSPESVVLGDAKKVAASDSMRKHLKEAIDSMVEETKDESSAVNLDKGKVAKKKAVFDPDSFMKVRAKALLKPYKEVITKDGEAAFSELVNENLDSIRKEFKIIEETLAQSKWSKSKK